MAELYADEDFPYPAVERLRPAWVMTSLRHFEAGQANQRIGDADQLVFATSLGRTILTRNRRHYILLQQTVCSPRFGIISHHRTIRILMVKRVALMQHWPAIQPSSVSMCA